MHYKSVVTALVILFAGNTIRVGISSLDIGVRQPAEYMASDAISATVREHDISSSSDRSTTTSSSSTITTPTTPTPISSGAAMSLSKFEIPPLKQQQQQELAPWSKRVMVVGGVGFIGFHTAQQLRQMGHFVVSFDLQPLHEPVPFVAIQGNACDAQLLYSTLESFQITHVVYLAASDEPNNIPKHSFEYPPNNLDCFATLLDIVRTVDLHIVYASHTTNDNPHPSLLDPASLQPNELMAQAYHDLYDISSIALRFPTVYGPRASPHSTHMAYLASIFDHFDHAKHNQNNTFTTPPPPPIIIPFINTPDNLGNMVKQPLQLTLIHVDDVVKNIVAALDISNQGPTILTIGRACAIPAPRLIQIMEDALVQITNQYNNQDTSDQQLAQPQNNNNTNNNTAHQTINTPIEFMDLSNSNPNPAFFANLTTPRCITHQTHGEMPIHMGIQNLVYWYHAQAQHLPIYHQTSTQQYSNPNLRQPEPLTDICHVTASFAEDESKADKVPAVDHLSHDPPNRYFFFTNLPNLACQGWERVILQDMPFRRFITQSRWPKFMGWKHPDLQSCKVILYADAIWRPKTLPMSEWYMLQNLTLASDAGIVQQIRPFNHSAMRELNFIRSHRKDIKRNVEASRRWFLNQPDFNNTSTSYRNNAFIYNPQSHNFRRLMTAFWTHYSQEEDSWRDQPLYRYLVNKLHLTPGLYPKNDQGKKGQVRDYWEEKGQKGFNGHHYKDKDDVSAAQLSRDSSTSIKNLTSNPHNAETTNIPSKTTNSTNDTITK